MKWYWWALIALIVIVIIVMSWNAYQKNKAAKASAVSMMASGNPTGTPTVAVSTTPSGHKVVSIQR